MSERARLALVTACGMVEDGVPVDDAVAAAAFAHDVTTAEIVAANEASPTTYQYMYRGAVRSLAPITPLEFGLVVAAGLAGPRLLRPPSPA